MHKSGLCIEKFFFLCEMLSLMLLGIDSKQSENPNRRYKNPLYEKNHQRYPSRIRITRQRE